MKRHVRIPHSKKTRARQQPDLIVCDESHKIDSPETKALTETIIREVRDFRTRFPCFTF